MKTLDPGRVRIVDTTLRDGEQAPGFGLSPAEKLRMARQLEILGVDCIEAGFPMSSESEKEAVRQIATHVRGTQIMAFARATEGDLVCAAQALETAAHPVIHTFVPASDLHLIEKMGWTRQQALDHAGTAIARGLQLVGTVQLGIEDASRADPGFLCELARTAAQCGASAVNLADTVGFVLPAEWAAIVSRVLAVPGMEKVVLSVHCHDDLGLAVSNSLSALMAGARQVECTINGIGERAGNAALEELVMSRLLSMLTGVNVPPNKAIVGRNAFAHEAGIHQAGVLKNPLTYEIITPEHVGFGGRELVVGKHSGRTGIAARLAQLGFDLSDDEFAQVYARFMAMCDAKVRVLEQDLTLIASVAKGTTEDMHELVNVEYRRDELGCVARVNLRRGRHPLTKLAGGSGPYDACATAINTLVGRKFTTRDVEIVSNTEGTECLANVNVQLLDEHGSTFSGRANGTDLVEACASAYLAAVNSALLTESAHGRKAAVAPSTSQLFAPGALPYVASPVRETLE
jgi:2-isopropylmalate synthase